MTQAKMAEIDAARHFLSRMEHTDNVSLHDNTADVTEQTGVS